VNQYQVFFARNWPDALLDRNGADDWPIHYDFAGTFQADDLDGLWALLNQDDRPNAHVERSMCVGHRYRRRSRWRVKRITRRDVDCTDDGLGKAASHDQPACASRDRRELARSTVA
jgi:hypothetical protein